MSSQDPSAASRLWVSSPGRICLFGEHQDYLLLPVIPAAISLRISIGGFQRDDREVLLDLPDIDSTERFSLDGPLTYRAERDYFRSAVNVVRREGFTFSRGLQCTVRGEIPINSGTSSSSALTVSWINFLTRASDQHRALDALEIARLAHAAEVLEFHEPGGMMDHYSTSCGGVLAIDFVPRVRVENLRPRLGAFVLGNSGEPKDTKQILARVKNQVLTAVDQLRKRFDDFSLQTVRSDSLERYRSLVSPAQFELLGGTVKNRDITRRALELLRKAEIDHRAIGRLLTDHQTVLGEILRISTPKIDRMLNAANAAGAYGGKINGSGGGGCMLAYAPEQTDAVARAIEKAGGKARVVTVDEGTRVDRPEGDR